MPNRKRKMDCPHYDLAADHVLFWSIGGTRIQNLQMAVHAGRQVRAPIRRAASRRFGRERDLPTSLGTNRLVRLESSSHRRHRRRIHRRYRAYWQKDEHIQSRLDRLPSATAEVISLNRSRFSLSMMVETNKKTDDNFSSCLLAVRYQISGSTTSIELKRTP